MPINDNKIKEYKRAWQIANPESGREASKRYRLKNPEKVKAGIAKYRAANTKKGKEDNKRWNENNPDKLMELKGK